METLSTAVLWPFFSVQETRAVTTQEKKKFKCCCLQWSTGKTPQFIACILMMTLLHTKNVSKSCSMVTFLQYVTIKTY